MATNYGISNSGFLRKRLDYLLDELNAEVRAVFGQNFNVSPESPDGQINGIISESNANLWELAEAAYNAFNPSAATGVTLSNLVQLNYITRIPASYSRALLTLTGLQFTQIPVNSIVKTEDTKAEFLLEQSVTIPSSGTVQAWARAAEIGPVYVAAGTLTQIETPVTGWFSVTNPEDAVLGTEEETDAELRARRIRSVSRQAQSILDSIHAEILAVPGVIDAVVLENDTNEENELGLPPHSIQAVVQGGAAEDIGNAIFIKKTVGATMFGDVSTFVYDTQAFQHTVWFSRPTEVPVYIQVNITLISVFPANGEELIKQRILEYVSGNLVEGRGVFLGDDVIVSELYTPVNTVPGFTVSSILVGDNDEELEPTDLIIGVRGLALFDADRIEVVVS